MTINWKFELHSPWWAELIDFASPLCSSGAAARSAFLSVGGIDVMLGPSLDGEEVMGRAMPNENWVSLCFLVALMRVVLVSAVVVRPQKLHPGLAGFPHSAQRNTFLKITDI